jgi:hypothetical protein
MAQKLPQFRLRPTNFTTFLKIWSGDDIIHCSHFVIVTEELSVTIRASDLSGCEIKDVLVTWDQKFEQWHPDIELPEFHWLRVTGDPGVDDFGMTEEPWLVVSEDALDTLREGTLEHAEIEPYSPSDNERG